MENLRIIYMGTGDIAIPSFQCLLDQQGMELLALVTQPDKPVGRKQIMTPPRIKDVAAASDICVMQPERARDVSFLNELTALKPDVIVVMAYGQILSQALLDIPSMACINLHASLLPKYRGAACIQAAIDAGDSYTGITVMHVIKALDAGDIILQKETAIGFSETAGALHDRLAEMAPEALLEVLHQFKQGTACRIPQDEAQVSYIPKLMREDGEIDWSQPAEALERRIRAYDPWPGTSTHYADKKGRKRRLKVFPLVRLIDSSGALGEPGEVLGLDDGIQVACGEGVIAIDCLQPDGSRRMNAADFMLSSPLAVGDRLGG